MKKVIDLHGVSHEKALVMVEEYLDRFGFPPKETVQVITIGLLLFSSKYKAC